MPQVNPKAEKILEDGWYKASIGETEMKDTKFGERLMVPFDVEADDETVEITAFISLSNHPKSNVVKWGKALFGERPFDTDEFSGLRCEVFVEEKEDDEGAPKNYIRKLRPAKGEKQAARPAAPKTDAEQTDEDLEEIPF